MLVVEQSVTRQTKFSTHHFGPYWAIYMCVSVCVCVCVCVYKGHQQIRRTFLTSKRIIFFRIFSINLMSVYDWFKAKISLVSQKYLRLS